MDTIIEKINNNTFVLGDYTVMNSKYNKKKGICIRCGQTKKFKSLYQISDKSIGESIHVCINHFKEGLTENKILEKLNGTVR